MALLPHFYHIVRRSFSKWEFLKISQISHETPIFESLFNKFAGLKVCSFIKETQVFFCEIWEIFKNNFFNRASPVAANKWEV